MTDHHTVQLRSKMFPEARTQDISLLCDVCLWPQRHFNIHILAIRNMKVSIIKSQRQV